MEKDNKKKKKVKVKKKNIKNIEGVGWGGGAQHIYKNEM